MKTRIVYASTHHGNTQKVAEAMAASIDAGLVDAVREGVPEVGDCGLVGLASGVYFGRFHESIQRAVREADFRPGQKVFLVDTCGAGYRDYSKPLRKELEQRGVTVVGSFQCRGYDTYSVFGKLGGIAKGHPNAKDLEAAALFARQMLDKAGE